MLNKLREEIDIIDDKILQLLVKRFEIVSLIGKHKKENGISIVQNNRMEFILNKAKFIAKSNDLNPDYFEKIYQAVTNIACELQEKLGAKMDVNDF